MTPHQATPPRFIDNGDGTVTDTQLGVMWTQATLSNEEVSYADAERLAAECRLGGYTDWHLPDIDPLLMLADRTRHEPAIDRAFFPDTRNDWYWTRSACSWAPRAAWIVLFSFGSSNLSNRGYHDAFVRACRALPSGQ